jgi:hypothetical protein
MVEVDGRALAALGQRGVVKPALKFLAKFY